MGPPVKNFKKDAASARASLGAANKNKNLMANEAKNGAVDTGEKKVKSDPKELARAAMLFRKAAAAKILAAEEAKDAAAGKKPTVASAVKKPTTAPGAALAAGALAADAPSEGLVASGLDNALDLLSLVNEKSDAASKGQLASKIEQHPERRFKGAFEAYKTETLPTLRKETPGLRLQQYEDLMFKDFQKSPLNPFNQVNLAHNATKDEKVEALDAINAAKEASFKN